MELLYPMFLDTKCPELNFVAVVVPVKR
jgi:hypothetical protein